MHATGLDRRKSMAGPRARFERAGWLADGAGTLHLELVQRRPRSQSRMPGLPFSKNYQGMSQYSYPEYPRLTFCI